MNTNINGYYSIGGLNGLGMTMPYIDTSAIVTSAASLKQSANAAEKEEIKRGLKAVGLAKVKANKTGWPFADFVIDQVNSEMSSGGWWSGVTDVFEKVLPTAAQGYMTYTQIQAREDAKKERERAAQRNASTPNYRPRQQGYQQGYRPQPSGTPGWVLPVAILGGVAVLGLGLFIALK